MSVSLRRQSTWPKSVPAGDRRRRLLAGQRHRRDEAAGQQARELLRAHRELAAPDLVDVETTAVLRRRWLASTITDERFEQAIEDLTDIPLARFPTLGLMRRAFELRANVTAYDACYVALAEALDWPLCTVDRRLAHASGPRCTMQLITPPD